MHGNASPEGKRSKFQRRAIAAISGFPASIEAQLKLRPYAALGVACAVGLGAGVLLSSRILRSVLVTTLSYAASHAAVEVGRAYLRQWEAPSG